MIYTPAHLPGDDPEYAVYQRETRDGYPKKLCYCETAEQSERIATALFACNLLLEIRDEMAGSDMLTSTEYATEFDAVLRAAKKAVK